MRVWHSSHSESTKKKATYEVVRTAFNSYFDVRRNLIIQRSRLTNGGCLHSRFIQAGRGLWVRFSISRSSRPEFRYFLPIITKKFNAIWNVPIRITTSENLFASLHCICLAFTHIARSNAITQCIFLTHGITDGLSVLENGIYCTELRWRAIC